MYWDVAFWMSLSVTAAGYVGWTLGAAKWRTEYAKEVGRRIAQARAQAPQAGEDGLDIPRDLEGVKDAVLRLRRDLDRIHSRVEDLMDDEHYGKEEP
jgi:hypothetical protein